MRTRATLTGLAALIAAGAAVTLADASSSDGRHDKRVHVLQVHRDVGNDFSIDADDSATPGHPAPDSVGDQVVFNGKFYVGSKQVGTDGGACTLVKLPSIYHCVATNSFDKGQLTVMWLGDFNATGPGYFAITGGTRAYRGATGEVTYIGTPDGADVTFRFTTPR